MPQRPVSARSAVLEAMVEAFDAVRGAGRLEALAMAHVGRALQALYWRDQHPAGRGAAPARPTPTGRAPRGETAERRAYPRAQDSAGKAVRRDDALRHGPLHGRSPFLGMFLAMHGLHYKG
jgi:hypothetical protein